MGAGAMGFIVDHHEVAPAAEKPPDRIDRPGHSAIILKRAIE
jgi:hypothetical protein